MKAQANNKKLGLPKYVTLEHGTYYYRKGKGKRQTLGRTYTEAMIAYAGQSRMQEGRLTVNDVIDRYIQEILPTKAPRTQETNLSEFKLLRGEFGERQPDQITAPDIYKYMDRRPSVRANREKSLLSHMFVKAIRWGAASRNPCRDVESYPEFKRTRMPSHEELNNFIALCPRWLRLYISLKYMTGLRQKDIIELTRQMLRDDGIAVVPSKSKRYNPQTKKREAQEVIIAWTPELKKIVAELQELHGKVARMSLFITSQGTPLSKTAFDGVWQRRMKMFVALYGPDSRFHEHDIRAVTASDDVEGAQKRLGHKQQSTTDIYIRSKASRTITPLMPTFTRS